MNKLTIPMWESGRKVLLSDILAKTTIDNPSWRLFDFEGQTRADATRPFSEIAHLLSSAGNRSGLGLTQAELQDFSESLVDIVSMRLEGLCQSSLAITIEAIDSTIWEVSWLPQYASFG